MIWTNLLLNISCFSFYLILAFNKSAVCPTFWTSLFGLVVLAVLPAFFSFHMNRNILSENPMVLKVLLANLVQYLLYAGLFVLGITLVKKHFLLASIEPLDWSVSILPLLWMLVSWLTGTYFGLKSAELLDADGYNIKVAEASLLIMIPSILLLTFKLFPLSILLMLISCWFVTLAFSLSLEGRGHTKDSVIRYDIIFFHLFISFLIAAVLFVIAFYGQVKQLLEVAQQGFIAFVYFIFGLLNSLFAEPSAVEPPPFDVPAFIPEPQMNETVQHMPFWLFIPFIILALFLLYIMLVKLIEFLKMRLGSEQVLPGKRYSIIMAFLQAWRWVFLLARNLFIRIFKVFGRVGKLFSSLFEKLKSALQKWLPPKTPYHKVFRTYEVFLRWGKKIGYPKKASETPLEYAKRLQAYNEGELSLSKEIEQLTAIFLKAHYGREQANWQQAVESEMLLKKVVSGVVSRGRGY